VFICRYIEEAPCIMILGIKITLILSLFVLRRWQCG